MKHQPKFQMLKSFVCVFFFNVILMPMDDKFVTRDLVM